MIIKRKLGPKGQIVIPKDIRDLLGIKAGSEVTLEVTGNVIKIKPPPTTEQFLNQFCENPKKLRKKIDIEKVIDEEYSSEK